MIIGIPKERKQGETRVGLTPDAVDRIIKQGHEVLIEDQAGLASGFTDEEYKTGGAEIITSLDELWSRADLIVKVKEPSPRERTLFRPDMAVFSFLHPAADADLVEKLVNSGITGIDFDLVSPMQGEFPILAPMSDIAGQLSVFCGFDALQPKHGGRGVLLAGLEGVEPASILVIGAGIAGTAAANTAIAAGANTCVLDIRDDALVPFKNRGENVRAIVSNAKVLEQEVSKADIVIGAVLVPGDLTPKLISRSLLSKFRRGAVLVDISIDQGGIAETSQTTSVAKPTYIVDEVVHYCVPNMPALVPRTSTLALTRAVFPWVEKLAASGVKSALAKEKALRKSLISLENKLCNETVALALGLESAKENEVFTLLK